MLWCTCLFLLFFSAVAIGPSGTYSSNSPASPLSSASLTSPLSPFSLVSGSQGSPTKPGSSEVSEPGCPQGAPSPHLGTGFACGSAWGHRSAHVPGLWGLLVTSGSVPLTGAVSGLLHQAA